MAAAEGRFLRDAAFHAKVYEVVETIERETRTTLDSDSRFIATLAAAIAMNRMPFS